MSLTLAQSEYFWTDLCRQTDWYRDHVNSDVAEDYVDAVQSSLKKLAKNPGLGRPRFKHTFELAGMHSWRAEKPFHRHLIFYRCTDQILFAERIVQGARDLPRRLLQSPYEVDE